MGPSLSPGRPGVRAGRALPVSGQGGGGRALLVSWRGGGGGEGWTGPPFLRAWRG